MAIDTFTQIWNRVLGHCPAVDPLLCQRWTVDAFRRIAERRAWSWLIKFGQFIMPQVYNTGLVSLTQGNAVVTGSGTAWTSDMVGLQFRVGAATPIYTIAQFISTTQIQLDLPWGGLTNASVGYQIYRAYVTPPDDFHAFISVWDPSLNWQLRQNISQQELNSWDAQRANTGQAYVVAALDYTTSTSGTVSAPMRIIGAGPSPSTGGDATYTGPSNAIFTIQITTGGPDGTAVFQWKKDSGTFTTGVVTDAGGGTQFLQDGVTIFFPLGQTYVVGDTFVIRTTVSNSSGLPRYELWPHNQANYVYPFLYEARAQDLDEPGAVLPRFIRGDVVMDLALAMASKWPGPSVDAPNPYFDLNLSDRIEKRCEQMIGEMERQDEEVYQSMVSYATNLQFSPWWDAQWLQSHGI